MSLAVRAEDEAKADRHTAQLGNKAECGEAPQGLQEKGSRSTNLVRLMQKPSQAGELVLGASCRRLFLN